MTFRQVLATLMREWLIIVIVVIVAMGAAGVFIAQQTPVYESTVTARLSSIAANAAGNGQIGNVQVDFNPETITSDEVLSPAAKSLGEPVRALEGQISYSTGSDNSSTQLSITATGRTSSEAMDRATAVEKSYNTYLEGQTKLALAGTQKQKAAAAAQAQAFQATLTNDSKNVLAQAGLQSALGQVNSAIATIQKITDAGPPLTTIASASPGDFQGVKPVNALLVALLAGLIAGIGIALIRDQFDNRLRDENELEKVTGVQSLGALSLDKQVARKGSRLPAGDRKRTALAEDLRSLRTTLQVLLPTTGAAVVFTSVEPGEGKTFISANLAVAWAKAGRDVILVGGDLRRPTLDHYFGAAADGPGLSTLLQRAAESGVHSVADIEAVLRSTEYPGLRVLPSGEEPAEPADILATSGLAFIIQSLRSACDIVIIDSPPAMALIDSSLLGAQADGVVVVASIRSTNRDQLANTVDTLVGSGVTVLGAVANRSRRRVPRSYGAYYGRTSGRSAAAPRPAQPTSFTANPAPQNPAPTPYGSGTASHMHNPYGVGAAPHGTNPARSANPAHPANPVMGTNAIPAPSGTAKE